MNRCGDLIQRYYGHLEYGQAALLRAIDSVLTRGTLVLDAGCGSDAPLVRRYSDRAEVVGIDLSPTFEPGARVVRGDLAKLPFQDGIFSLIFSRSVFEHLEDPSSTLDEFHRVLRPGGFCVIQTPNKWDYTSIIAAMTPQWFHRWYVESVYDEAGSYDTFPVRYRANTPRYFRQVAANGRWKPVRIDGLRHYPANLIFSRVLFRLGVLYDRALDAARWSSLQPTLLILLQKMS